MADEMTREPCDRDLSAHAHVSRCTQAAAQPCREAVRGGARYCGWRGDTSWRSRRPRCTRRPGPGRTARQHPPRARGTVPAAPGTRTGATFGGRRPLSGENCGPCALACSSAARASMYLRRVRLVRGGGRDVSSQYSKGGGESAMYPSALSSRTNTTSTPCRAPCQRHAAAGVTRRRARGGGRAPAWTSRPAFPAARAPPRRRRTPQSPATRARASREPRAARAARRAPHLAASEVRKLRHLLHQQIPRPAHVTLRAPPPRALTSLQAARRDGGGGGGVRALSRRFRSFGQKPMMLYLRPEGDPLSGEGARAGGGSRGRRARRGMEGPVKQEDLRELLLWLKSTQFDPCRFKSGRPDDAGPQDGVLARQTGRGGCDLVPDVAQRLWRGLIFPALRHLTSSCQHSTVLNNAGGQGATATHTPAECRCERERRRPQPSRGGTWCA